jgi:hypothetical protein
VRDLTRRLSLTVLHPSIWPRSHVQLFFTPHSLSSWPHVQLIFTLRSLWPWSLIHSFTRCHATFPLAMVTCLLPLARRLALALLHLFSGHGHTFTLVTAPSCTLAQRLTPNFSFNSLKGVVSCTRAHSSTTNVWQVVKADPTKKWWLATNADRSKAGWVGPSLYFTPLHACWQTPHRTHPRVLTNSVWVAVCPAMALICYSWIGAVLFKSQEALRTTKGVFFSHFCRM